MQVKIQEMSATYLRIQITQNDPHTLYNILREEVIKNEGVKLCGYARDNTFEDSIVFQIEVEEGYKPVDILLDSVKSVKKINQQFRDAFEDAFEFD